MVVIKKYKLEADMCVELTKWLESLGCDVYPEQDGWDLLAIRGKVKFGIQAKLTPNLKVISQALQGGPQYKCVAIGGYNSKTIHDFMKIAKALRLIIINMGVDERAWMNWNKGFWNPFSKGYDKVDWFYYRHEPGDIYVSPIKVAYKAGIKSPKTVSQWKIGVCYLEMLLRKKGYVNVHDVEELVEVYLPYKKKQYARTLLNDFCKNTGIPDPDYPRCKKFILKPRISPPSKRFKEIYKALREQDK